MIKNFFVNQKNYRRLILLLLETSFQKINQFLRDSSNNKNFFCLIINFIIIRNLHISHFFHGRKLVMKKDNKCAVSSGAKA